MPSLLIQLAISADDLLDYYRGSARVVHAVAADGRTVNFPASALQRHVTEAGVHGWFRLEFDEKLKFVSLERTKPDGGINVTA